MYRATDWRREPLASWVVVPLLFRHSADRVEIAIDVAGPEGRGKHHPVPIPARHLEVKERTLATRRLERGKVRAAMVEAVEGVVVAVEPQGRIRKHPAAPKQCAVDLARIPASFAHPAAHEVDHAGDLARVHPGVGDRKDAAA